MAVIKNNAGTNTQGVDANNAARVSVNHPFVDDASGGRFRISTKSGLLTTIAAQDGANAGHLWSFRNPTSTKKFVVDYLRIRAAMVTDFTTLQELSISARRVFGFTVLHSAGGAAVTLTGNEAKTRTSQQASEATQYHASAAAAITGQTIATRAARAFLENTAGFPSAGATTNKIPAVADFVARRDGGPIVLTQDEGILIQNEVLMGAAGTMVLGVEMQWRELLNADAVGL